MHRIHTTRARMHHIHTTRAPLCTTFTPHALALLLTFAFMQAPDQRQYTYAREQARSTQGITQHHDEVCAVQHVDMHV